MPESNQNTENFYTQRPKAKWFLVQFLIIFGIAAAIWWHYQGYAWWLTSQVKFDWGAGIQNYKVSTNLTLDVKNVQVQSSDFGVYLPQKDFNLKWEDFRLTTQEDFLGQSSVLLNIDGQGPTDLLFHYRKSGDFVYFIPHIFGTEEGRVLADRIYGPPYTTVAFAYGDSLTNPNNNNGLSENQIFALYDYLVLGEQAWSSVNNNANKAKVFLYLDIWGKDNNSNSPNNVFPSPAYFITPSFPSGMGSLPANQKPDGTPYAYIQNDAYFADLLGMIEDFYAGLDSQGIDLAGIFLDDFYEAADVWEETMANNIEAIAWPGRGQDEASQEAWWANIQYPRMVQFEADLHDLTAQYFGTSKLIINGPMRNFRTLPSGLREPYFYNNPLYTPNKISIRCFEGPTVSTDNYANFPEMLRDPSDTDNYKYWRAFFPKDLLLMYSVDGTVSGQNGEYGDWINEPPYVGSVDWPYATDLANDHAPDTAVALAYGSTPATGGSRLSLFTDPIDWPFAVQEPTPYCGDGDINQASEECDDGNVQNNDGCSSTCQIESYCGDGDINQASEECDDGDNQNGDGCSSTCQIEEEEDDQAICGDDHLTSPQEQCDDGNTQNGDGCSSLCQIEEEEDDQAICGDREINQSWEQCDDGNILNNDGCTSTCQLEDNQPQEEPQEQEQEQEQEQDAPNNPPTSSNPGQPDTPANQEKEDEVKDTPPAKAETIFDFPDIMNLPQPDLQSEWTVTSYTENNFIINTDMIASQVLSSFDKPNIFGIKDTHETIKSADGKLHKIQYNIKAEQTDKILEAIGMNFWSMTQNQLADWKRQNPLVWQQWQNFVQQVDFYLWINTKTKNIHGIEVSAKDLAVDIGSFKGDITFEFSYLLLADDINNVPKPQNTMTVSEFLSQGTLDQILSTNIIYADALKQYFMSYDAQDTDNDGLTNGEETYYGTDSQDPDSDDDGYPDGQEIQNGYNPLGSG